MLSSSTGSLSPMVSRNSTRHLISKQGNLLKREKGVIRTIWKERYVTIFEGSLLYYQSSTDLTPKGVIHLLSAKIEEIQEKKAKRRYCFSLQIPTKEDLVFACLDSAELQDWISAITENIGKEPLPLPQKDFKIKGKSPSIYVTSKIAETIASMGVGGKIIREMLSDEAILIIDSVRNFLVQRLGAEKTAKFEKHLISLSIKAALSYKEKKLNNRDIAAVNVPIRVLVSRLIDAYEIPFTLNVTEIADNIRDVQAAFDTILRPILDEKSHQKFVNMFNVICDEDLIEDFYEKRKWRECEIISTTLRELWDNGQF